MSASHDVEVPFMSPFNRARKVFVGYLMSHPWVWVDPLPVDFCAYHANVANWLGWLATNHNEVLYIVLNLAEACYHGMIANGDAWPDHTLSTQNGTVRYIRTKNAKPRGWVCVIQERRSGTYLAMLADSGMLANIDFGKEVRLGADQSVVHDRTARPNSSSLLHPDLFTYYGSPVNMNVL